MKRDEELEEADFLGVEDSVRFSGSDLRNRVLPWSLPVLGGVAMDWEASSFKFVDDFRSLRLNQADGDDDFTS